MVDGISGTDSGADQRVLELGCNFVEGVEDATGQHDVVVVLLCAVADSAVGRGVPMPRMAS
jgi:hypothetical protein